MRLSLLDARPTVHLNVTLAARICFSTPERELNLRAYCEPCVFRLVFTSDFLLERDIRTTRYTTPLRKVAPLSNLVVTAE